jgi:hypothetical protein
LAGIACVWYYRYKSRFYSNVLFTGWRVLLFAGIVPLTSALFVASVGIYQLPQLGLRVSVISIGTILIGIVPELNKRHDDRIDGKGIAWLNVDLVNCRIEFGAYGGFHFHRLDDAKRFARPYRMPGSHQD